MPHNTVNAEGGTGEVFEAEVVERLAVGGKDTVWQASITMPQGGASHSGRQRVFTMRGPPRKSRDQAENDASQLTNASTQGAKVVRMLANTMHKPT